MATRKQISAMRRTVDELNRVLHQHDAEPGTQMVIWDMLRTARKVAGRYPRAAAVLIERSATWLAELRRICTREEVEAALQPVGGFAALKPDKIGDLWFDRSEYERHRAPIRKK